MPECIYKQRTPIFLLIFEENILKMKTIVRPAERLASNRAPGC